MMEDGIIYLKRTKANVCGGTDATLDTAAPKKIDSDLIRVFFAESALGFSMGEGFGDRLTYVSAYAAPCDAGTILCLSSSYDNGRTVDFSHVVIKEDVMTPLASLVKRLDLAKNNGYHSRTHGLPRNFGGEVRIEFEGGEKISYSNNQTPILKGEEGEAIYEFFKEAMSKETADLPEADGIASVTYYDKKADGYTRASLTIRDDGTGVNVKESLFSDEDTPYVSEKEVTAETVDFIKNTAKNSEMFAWRGLPENRYSRGEETLTFRFRDGKEITVDNKRDLPRQLGGGFFKIELELETKN